MAQLPPPPTRAPDGSFAWVDWYNKLRDFVSNAGNIAWTSIDFTGSNISNIQVRDHNLLTNIQGGSLTERYHLTLAQYSALTAGPHNNLSGLQGGTAGQYYHLTAAEYTALQAFNYQHNTLTGLQGGTTGQYYHLTSTEYSTLQAGQFKLNSKTTDPVAADIPSGFAAMYKNTTTNVVKLWVNDGGTFKSVTLT